MAFIAHVCAENIMVLIEQETTGLTEEEKQETIEILIEALKTEQNE